MTSILQNKGETQDLPKAEKGPSELTGSVLTTVAGKREIKVYVLTEDNLDTLSVLNGLFNLCLALSTAFLSFGGGVMASITLSSGVPETIKSTWLFLSIFSLIIGSIFTALCLYSYIKRESSVSRIKRETIHNP